MMTSIDGGGDNGGGDDGGENGGDGEEADSPSV